MVSVFQNRQQLRNDSAVTFTLSPTHVAYANTLRRLCMTGVETVGFRADIRDDGSTSDVNILANSTPMTNEMLAHRIGLIPIHVQQPTKWDDEEFTFMLNVENESYSKSLDVCASDIHIQDKSGNVVPSSRFFPPNRVTNETCLLAILKPRLTGAEPECIRFEAKATKGTGRENARFIPTTQCAYSYTRDTDPEHIEQAFKEWLSRAKKINDSAILEKEPEKLAMYKREFATLEINRCYLRDEETGEPYSFDFTVESAGVLPPDYIVARACEVGATMFQRYAGETLPEDVVVQYADGRIRGYDFIFQKQDHTLGHCIQAWLDQNLVGNGEITFAGYDVPHPLRDEMVIRIGTKDETDATARRALRQAMTACGNMFLSWRDNWMSLALPAALAKPTPLAQPTKAKRQIEIKKKVIRE